MKRFFSIVAVALLSLATLTPASAQRRGEWMIKGGLGELSLPDIVGVLATGLSVSFDSTEGTETKEFAPLLNPNVEILYGINNWFALGASVSAGYCSAKSVFVNTGGTNKSSKAFYPSLQLCAKTTYFRSGRFSMYGSWGVGAMGFFVDQWTADGSNNLNSDAITIMGNAYPLCFSYGGRTGGFAELGWGAKGFVNVGIYHAF